MRSLGSIEGGLVVDNELKNRLVTDYKSASVGEQNMAILKYVEKLTLTPSEISKGDVAALREHGFDDTGVHDIVQVASYFNYVNRLADGLGVELEG